MKFLIWLEDKIFVAGHRGLVGSAIVRQLERKGFSNIITRTHKELDLINQIAVQDFFKLEKPSYIILAVRLTILTFPQFQFKLRFF